MSNLNTNNADGDDGPQHQIREILAQYLQTAWPLAYPILWQNMPAPDGVAHGTAKAWAQCHVMVRSIRALDVSRQHHMVRGQVQMIATAPKDSGMAALDQIVDAAVSVFQGASPEGVVMGSIAVSPPRDDRGYVVVPISVAFRRIITSGVIGGHENNNSAQQTETE